MAGQPKFTTDMIRVRATEQSYTRGEAYYRQDAIFNKVKRGNIIEGFCEAGSQPEPYHVRAHLSEEAILETHCTCAYSYGGDCKHVVALLLNYVHEPETFEERLPLEDALNERDKSDLIGLILKMVKHYPDLQALIDLPSPSRIARQMPVDTSSLRSQLQRTFSSYDYWENRSAEDAILTMLETAEEFARLNDWHNAVAICRTILETVESNVNIFYADEEGEIGSAVGDVIKQLGSSLDQPEIIDHDDERRGVFDSLLSMFLTDIDVGGYGFADEAGDYILRYARAADLPQLRKRMQERLARLPRQRDWARQAYAEFEAELDVLDNVDPEVTLARLRESGLYSLLVGKLIELKRYDEAVQVVEQHITNAQARFLELQRLTAVGRDDDAVRLAQQTLRTGYDMFGDRPLMDWLLARLEARGDTALLFEWQLRRMQAEPSEKHYAELKAAALPLGNWDRVRTDLIRQLEKMGRYDVLTTIYLHDEEWDEAWAALKQVKSPSGYYYRWMSGYASLDLEVASRSRFARPALALPVYIEHARQSIDRRNRDSYREAAEYLSIARELYLKLNDSASWLALIREIREVFKRLPALQDELNKAGL
jgi:uncharacterized Zn finger protein